MIDVLVLFIFIAGVSAFAFFIMFKSHKVRYVIIFMDRV